MTRESTDVDTAEQVIDSFRILAADKVIEEKKTRQIKLRVEILLLLTGSFIKHSPRFWNTF